MKIKAIIYYVISIVFLLLAGFTGIMIIYNDLWMIPIPVYIIISTLTIMEGFENENN